VNVLQHLFPLFHAAIVHDVSTLVAHRKPALPLPQPARRRETHLAIATQEGQKHQALLGAEGRDRRSDLRERAKLSHRLSAARQKVSVLFPRNDCGREDSDIRTCAKYDTVR
jgi:hypothetical protein